jgi:hypothetical protein
MNSNAIEQQYQERKAMSPKEVVLTWKEKTNPEILFSEFCFYNLESYKKSYGEANQPDDFLMTMHHLCFKEESPTDRPNACFVYWYRPSERACDIAISILTDESLDEDLRIKLQDYISFHNDNLDEMITATKLMSDYAFQIQPLDKLLKHKLKIKLFKVNEFQDKIIFALRRLAFTYAGQIKETFMNPNFLKGRYSHENKIIEFEDFTNDSEYLVGLDKNKILNPTLLTDFKEDKIAYLQILNAWLTDVLEHHKEYISATELPKAYNKAFVFLEDIQQNLEKTKNEKSPEETNQQPKERLAATPAKIEKSYPNRIFETSAAYDLFCTWVEKATIKKQIEFIFRHMSEKENPPLILVRDKEFRKWYNAQDQTIIQLETTTATYENTKNHDRLFAYQLAKKCIARNH